jgi:hypothetical protein
MAIDRIDSKVVTRESHVGSVMDPLPAGRRDQDGLGRTMAVARTAVMLVLASLAILVLLPAAIAAQAATI